MQRTSFTSDLHATSRTIFSESSFPGYFETFIPTAQTMLGDFQEIDKQQVNAKRLFKEHEKVRTTLSKLNDLIHCR